MNIDVWKLLRDILVAFARESGQPLNAYDLIRIMDILEETVRREEETSGD